MHNGARTAAGWTLILWDIENVPVPEQLRDPSGIKQLKDLLKDRFAKTRSLQLHCIKLACRWPDCRSPYANLLGWLTTLGDVEALGYQWQGQKDKIHNADRLLKQAADRFMHMLELHGGPEHLVVFITSDQDFCEKIQELQRRNFKVVVLYHGPSASQKPVSITSVADESHDWLTFLKRELGLSHLTLAPYDPSAYHGSSQGYNSGMTPPPPSATTRQPSQESRTPSKAGSRPSSAGTASPHMQRAPSQASHKRQDSMCIKVARDQDFQDQIGSNQWFDMMDPTKVAQFWVHNKVTVSEFKRTLANKWGTALKSQRLWPWQRRQNLSVRLSSPVDSSLDGQRLADVAVPILGEHSESWFYLEEAKNDKPLVTINPGKMLLFFKFYDPWQKTLSYLGRCYAHDTNTLPALMPFLYKKAGLPDGTALKVYEEVKSHPKVMCDVVEEHVTFQQAQLQHGDILLVQQALTEEEAEKLKYPNVKSFLKHMSKGRATKPV
ncbi:TPA: hypothetical protein ACH3X2_001945 [Trebouxia sp. C0005]